MKNAKVMSAKRSFFMSVLSLVLCFAMLLGTTWAWFTDEVTSGVNQIKAGNLDIEVSYKENENWVSIEGKDSLFNKNALWEPGHTEFVTLKIENKGNLALNYKLMVSPVTEKGGVNVSGQSFKLSDYLMFGVNSTDTDPNYSKDDTGRTAARNAASGATKLNAITKTGTMTTKDETKYVTLVVYMPETVGNEANYKTGTTAPEIELGIKVIATQLQAEVDSFDSTYDAGAVNDSFYVVGPAYNYFPQISTTVTKADSGNTEITYSGRLNKDDAAETTLVKATVPAAALEDNVESITVTVKPQEAAAATTGATALAAEISAGREVVNFDVKISGVKEGNTTAIPMEVFVGTGLSNVKVYHNGTLIEGATYDSATGIAKFNATTFSDYSFAYDAVCARIGEKTYGSLALAVAAAKDGETVTLLKSVEGSGVMLKAADEKIITINLDGKTYTFADPAVGSIGTETQGFHFEKGNTVTVKNGTLNAKSGNKNVKMLIQNYCNLTLDGVTVDGTNLNGATTGRYVVSNNCGTVAINNSTITAATNDVAFDSCKFGSYEIPTVTVTNSTINGKIELSGGKLNITSGTVNGEIGTVTGYAAGDCSITGGTFSSDPSAYVADGYKATKSGNVWTVVPVYAKIGSEKYDSLSKAFAAVQNGQTVEVLRNEENPVSLNDGRAYYFTKDNDTKATAIANTSLVVLINDKTGENGQEYDYQAEGVIGTDCSIYGSIEALIEKTNAGHATNTSTLKQAMGASGYTYFCLYDDWTLANNVTLQPYNACASWIYTCGGDIVIDLNGHKINQISGFGDGGDVYATNNGWAAIEAYSGSLEIKDTKGSGEIVGAKTALDVLSDNVSVTLTSGTLTSRGIAKNHSADGRVVAIQTSAGSFTMNGGTLQFDLFEGVTNVNAAIALFKSSENAVVTINGGTINAPEGKVVTGAASTIDTSKATIVIK